MWLFWNYLALATQSYSAKQKFPRREFDLRLSQKGYVESIKGELARKLAYYLIDNEIGLLTEREDYYSDTIEFTYEIKVLR